MRTFHDINSITVYINIIASSLHDKIRIIQCSHFSPLAYLLSVLCWLEVLACLGAEEDATENFPVNR